MKPFLKIFLMAVAYLAIFILGASSGAIHPACYAYAGAVLAERALKRQAATFR